jgi:hypothetical protein
MSQDIQVPVLLSTVSKDKIGRHLSYPLGAESLSRAFVDFPQAVNSSVRFNGKSVRLSSLSDAMQHREDICTILTCSCESKYGDTYGAPYLGKLRHIAWKVAVYPVLREWKPIVSEALQTEGLPKLRDFLKRTYVTGEKPEAPFFHITFDPSENKLGFSPS